jgi:hypothetical protein
MQIIFFNFVLNGIIFFKWYKYIVFTRIYNIFLFNVNVLILRGNDSGNSEFSFKVKSDKILFWPKIKLGYDSIFFPFALISNPPKVGE